MYVTRVRVTDIKGFSGRRAVDLALPGRGGWTVLAGRNGSGKSTLLQAIALALCGPEKALALNAGAMRMVTEGADVGSVVVDIHTDAEADGFSGPETAGAPPEQLRLGLLWRTLLTRPGLGRRSASTLVPQLGDAEREAVVDGPWSPVARGWFCAGYGPFRRLSGGLGSGYTRDEVAAGNVATLFHEDAALGESVAWLIDLHHRTLEAEAGSSSEAGSAAGLLNTVLSLLSDGLMPHELQVNGVSADGLWVSTTGDDIGFPLREMSDGYRTVAALVLDIARQMHAAYGELKTWKGDGGRIAVLQPGVVLIDEVDTHLHVTWQRRIGDWLREHFPHVQFIVTSHSPYICQAADENALVRLPGPDEDEPPAVVDDDLYRRVVFGSADDAALSELFGLDTPYSSRGEEHRRRLVALERKVYADAASDAEVAEYQALSRLLTSSVESRVAEVAARLDPEQG